MEQQAQPAPSPAPSPAPPAAEAPPPQWRPTAEDAAKLTPTQLDTLRHQIAAFSHVCNQAIILAQQKVEEGKSFNAPGNSLPGRGAGVMHALSSSMGISASGAGAQPSYPAPVYNKNPDGPRGPSAPRWNPTPAQLARLEELFLTGMGTPNGELRTQITEELAKLGPINEANVYNWFQNKKARMKKAEREREAALVAGRPPPV